MNAPITLRENIIEKIISLWLIARTEPNKYEFMFEAVPARDEIIIPKARAADDTTAIAISPAVLYFLLTNMIIKDAEITEGAAIKISGIFRADEIESDAKPISESPCPIKE